VNSSEHDQEFEPVFLEPGGPVYFPDPRLADTEGLLAVGGDLSADRLLHAYESAVFPWFDPGFPPFWWSPDPRCVIRPEKLRVTSSLDRRIRRGGFQLTWNRQFAAVMLAGSEGREEGTWIGPEMLAAYTQLHEQGHAHSLEVWVDAELVGGIYGVQRGGLFAAESMFHRQRDMSKIALVACIRSLFGSGMKLFDVQFLTEHLASLGAEEVSRDDYLAELSGAVELQIDLSDLTPVCRV
jgi:leucyl/phenylalanyl-tRNA--protein transferase